MKKELFIPYPMERDKFIEILEKHFNGKELDELFDYITEGFVSESFKLLLQDEEVYIICLSSGVIINWYKLCHVGRCLNFNTKLSEDELDDIFEKLHEEILKM